MPQHLHQPALIQPDKPEDTAIEMPHILPIAQGMEIGFEPIKDIQIVPATLPLDAVEAMIDLRPGYAPPNLSCSDKKPPKLTLHLPIIHIIN